MQSGPQEAAASEDLDRYGNGYSTAAELNRFATNLGAVTTGEEVDEFGGHAQVNQEEIVKLPSGPQLTAVIELNTAESKLGQDPP